MNNQRGLFISLEGLDGCGKTSTAKKIVEYVTKRGLEVVHVREPGGTYLGEKVRSILIEKQDDEFNSPVDSAELLLFMASRMQIVEKVIKPAIREGKIVVSERFMDSTYALQGFGRDLLTEVMALDSTFLRGFQPDVTYLLDISVEEANKRQDGQMRKRDRFESEGDHYHELVAEGFKYRLQHDPVGRIIRINGEQTPENVQKDINKHLENVLNKTYGRHD